MFLFKTKQVIARILGFTIFQSDGKEALKRRKKLDEKRRRKEKDRLKKQKNPETLREQIEAEETQESSDTDRLSTADKILKENSVPHSDDSDDKVESDGNDTDEEQEEDADNEEESSGPLPQFVFPKNTKGQLLFQTSTFGVPNLNENETDVDENVNEMHEPDEHEKERAALYVPKAHRNHPASSLIIQVRI